MPKFMVMVVETTEHSVEIEAHDADAARVWAQQVIATDGMSGFEFGGVIERTIDVEEMQ